MEEIEWWQVEQLSEEAANTRLELESRIAAVGSIVTCVRQGLVLSDSIIGNLEKAFEEDSRLDSALVQALALHGTTQLSSKTIAYLGTLLKNNQQEIDGIASIFKAQTIKYNASLGAPNTLKISSLLNDAQIKKETRENFAYSLEVQVKLGLIETEKVLPEVEKCYANNDSKLRKLQRICGSIFEYILQSTKLPLSFSSVLHQNLEQGQHTSSTIDILLASIAKQDQEIPAKVLLYLYKITKNVKGYKFGVRCGAAVIILQAIISSHGDRVKIQAIESVFGNKPNKLKDELFGLISVFLKKEEALPSAMLVYFERLLMQPLFKDFDVISAVLKKHVMKHDFRLKIDGLKQLSTLLNDASISKKARENFAYTLDYYLKFNIDASEYILPGIAECYRSKELKYICGSILERLTTKGIFSANTIDILEAALKEPEIVKDTVKILLLLVSKQDHVLPSSTLSSLSSLLEDRALSIKVKELIITAINYSLVNAKNTLQEVMIDSSTLSRLECMLGTEEGIDNALWRIFSQVGHNTKLNESIILYFEKWLDDLLLLKSNSVCNEFVEIVELDDLERISSTDIVCSHIEKKQLNTAAIGWNKARLGMMVEVFGFQSINYGVRLSYTTLNTISLLLNNEDLSEIVRVNLVHTIAHQIEVGGLLDSDSLGEVVRCFAESQLEQLIMGCGGILLSLPKTIKFDNNILKALEESLKDSRKIQIAVSLIARAIIDGQVSSSTTIDKLSSVAANGSIEDISRHMAAASLIAVISRGKNITNNAAVNLEKALISDLGDFSDDLGSGITKAIGILAKRGVYNPSAKLLPYFENLLEAKDSVELGIYGIESILRVKGASIAKPIRLKILGIALSHEEVKLKATAIYILAHDIHNRGDVFPESSIASLEPLLHAHGLKEAVFFAFLNHVKNKGALSSPIIIGLVEKLQASEAVSLLYALSQNHQITDTKVLEFLGNCLKLVSLSSGNRRDALKILEANRELLEGEVEALVEQEELSSKLKGGSGARSTLEKLKKHTGKGYSLSASMLFALEEYLKKSGDESAIRIIYKLTDNLLENDKSISPSFIGAIIDTIKSNGKEGVLLLVKCVEKTSYKSGRLLQVLVEALGRDALNHEETNQLIKGVSLLVSRGEVLSDSAFNDLLAITNKGWGAKNVASSTILLFGALLERGASLPDSIFSKVREFLSSGDELQTLALNFYKQASYRHIVPDEDIKALLKLLTTDRQKEVLSIISNFNKVKPLNANDFEEFSVNREIFSFYQSHDIKSKVASISNLAQLLTVENADKLVMIFKEGLTYLDKRLLFASLRALNKAKDFKVLTFKAAEIRYIASGLRFENIKLEAQKLLSDAGIKLPEVHLREIEPDYPINKDAELLLLGNASKYDAAAFDMSLAELEIPKSNGVLFYGREVLLGFLYAWQQSNNYTLPQVSYLLAMLSYTNQTFAQLKLSPSVTLDDAESRWILSKLEILLPEAILEQDTIGKVKSLLVSFDLALKNRLLGVKGLQTVGELESFLDFIYKHRFDANYLHERLDSDEDLAGLYKSMKLTILLQQAYRKFLSPKSLEPLARSFEVLLSNGWSSDGISELFEIVDIKDSGIFIKAIKIVADYGIPEHVRNAQGLTVKKILDGYSSSDWVSIFRKFALHYHFGIFSGEKSLDKLLLELREYNHDNPKVLEFLDLKPEEQLEKTNIIGKELLSNNNLPINDWQEEDILKWSLVIAAGKAICAFHNVSPEQSNICAESNVTGFVLEEALAVIKRAVFLVHGYEPRDIQLLSALMLYTSGNGMLAEISTGEGKSLIVAIFAILKALEGTYVDVVTSSPLLAARDAAEQAPLYALFGLSVATSVVESIEERKDAYKKHIVYGDVRSFIADILNHEYNGIEIRGDRGFHIVLIDEVDNMLIDQSSHIVMLSHPIPTFENLEHLLISIWEYLLSIKEQMVHLEAENKLVFVTGKFTYEGQELTLLDDAEVFEIEDYIKFTKDMLIEYTYALIEYDQERIFIPAHLKAFVKGQVELWAESAIEADLKRQNEYYVLEPGDNGVVEIKPVDSKNTGVVQSNMHWSNGLHQFLSIKHGIKLRPESLISSFMSNVAFFKRYGSDIYGMTGTLGAESEKALLKEMYDVDFAKVPTFKTKRFIKLPTVFVPAKDAWYSEIMEVVQEETRYGRAVLVIAETIKEAELIEKLLQQRKFPTQNIRKYVRNEDEGVVKDKLKPGEVIIATNLAGRGTDFKLTSELETSGGLHVLMTYLPKSMRVGSQGDGRAARQGDIGTASTIISQKDISYLKFAYPWYSATTTADIIKWRDLAEGERLLRNQYSTLEVIRLKDALFNRFSELYRCIRDGAKDMSACTDFSLSQLDSLNQEGENIANELAQIEELWALWLHDQEKLMKYEIDHKIEPSDRDVLSRKNLEIRMMVLQNFEEFKVSIVERLITRKLMENPSYLVKRGLQTNSIRDLDLAIAKDDFYSWVAYYAKARVIIKTDGSDKQKAYENLEWAKIKLQNYTIPYHESMLHLLNIRNVTDGHKALSKQINKKILLLHKHGEYIEKAQEIIAKSTEKEKIELSREVSLVNVIEQDPSDNLSEAEEFKEVGLENFFEVRAVEIEEDDDGWFGTFFSAVAGVFQIIVGAVVTIGSAGLLAKFGASMIVSGARDIFNAIKSVISGKPINIEQYLKGKAIEYAINILLIGVEFLATKIKAGYNAAKNYFTGAKDAATNTAKEAAKETVKTHTKDSVMNLVKTQLIKQGVITGISYAGEVIAGDILNDHRGKIEKKVRQRIAETIAYYKGEIAKIISADAFNKNREGQRELYNSASNILRKYEHKYHSVARTIATGALSGGLESHIPGISTAVKVAEIGQALVKITEATDQFCDDFEKEIRKIAGRSKTSSEMMKETLSSSYTKTDVAALMSTLTQFGVITNQGLVCSMCSSIPSFNFGMFEPTEEVIQMSCFSVCNVTEGDYSSNSSELANDLVKLLTSSIIHMVQGEILSPVTQLGASYLAERIFEPQAKAQQEINKQLKADKIKYAAEVGTKVPVGGDAKKANKKAFTASLAKSSLSVAEQEGIRRFVESVSADPEGGIREARLASNALNSRVNVYRDGKLDRVFEPVQGIKGYKKGPPIAVHYNSITQKWSDSYIGLLGSSSIYEPLSKQAGLEPLKIRESISQYLVDHPLEAQKLMQGYRFSGLDKAWNKRFADFKSASSNEQVNQKVWQNPDELYGSSLSNSGKDSKLERFRSLVPKEHFNARELGVLNDAVYKNSRKEIGNALQRKGISSIKIIDEHRDPQTGFYGVLFEKTLANGEKVYVEVYRGTDSPLSLSSVLNSPADLEDDFSLLRHKLPEQAGSAAIFHQKVLQKIGTNKNLYATGHSLGDALAQINGAKFTDDYKSIIGFDGPGMKETLAQAKVNTAKLQDKLVLFKARPHAINSHGTHLVSPICFDNNGNEIPRYIMTKTGQVLRYSLNLHESKHLPEAFNDDGPNKIVEVQQWPVIEGISHTKELLAHFNDYSQNPQAWDKYFENLWQDNRETHSTSDDQIDSFEKFRQDSINQIKRLSEQYSKEK